uniref:Ribonuclease H-like domain-containing protein n=1 Tax=Tanacetum cinerariifolium TaxID=118510 RepID=A0A6L2N5V9_TANCI|nr:ribonuclease H-like domain-containing protein [Tanacetum cinerariifolium]
MVIRSRVRTTHPNPRYIGHVSTISPLPRFYKEAFIDPNWRNAMFEEYNAIIKNKTWTSVSRSECVNIVRCMRLFRHKFLADGTLSRYKARLVANGSTQRKYAVEILERAHMVGCNPSRTPVDNESKLGDGGTPQVCIYIHDLREPHFSALKRILRAEAEYRSVANVVAETCWIQNLLRELYTPLSSATIVYCDNVSVVYFSSNPVQHQRTKHIEIDIHFVRDLVATAEVRVLHVHSRFQYADIFTKGLPSALFDEFRGSLREASTKSTTTPSYDFLDDSTNLISTLIHTTPITPVPASVHTPQFDVPTMPTPPTPPPPPTPQSFYKEAFNDPNWRNAMFEEYNAIIKNKTWTSVSRSKCANIVRCMRLFRHKFLADGTLSRYKARLVSNGSTQVEGVDVDETFSPVVKSGTIRTVLSLAISLHWPVHQLDVKNAFLHGDLAETVYMHQPLGFRDPEHSNYRKYAMEILERAHMVGCNPSRTPVNNESKLGDGGTPVVDLTLYRSLAGSLQYLIITRPDIIFRYVQGTFDYGLQLFSSTTRSLIAYSDADSAGCPTTRWSTSGYCVFIGNYLFSWSSKRQPTLSRSSAEAEYRGVANAVAETCWIRNLLHELHTPLSLATIVYCDNVSVVYLSSNPVQHQRTKHIEIDIHFVWDLVATGQVRILHVPSRF